MKCNGCLKASVRFFYVTCLWQNRCIFYWKLNKTYFKGLLRNSCKSAGQPRHTFILVSPPIKLQADMHSCKSAWAHMVDLADLQDLARTATPNFDTYFSLINFLAQTSPFIIFATSLMLLIFYHCNSFVQISPLKFYQTILSLLMHG